MLIEIYKLPSANRRRLKIYGCHRTIDVELKLPDASHIDGRIVTHHPATHRYRFTLGRVHFTGANGTTGSFAGRRCRANAAQRGRTPAANIVGGAHQQRESPVLLMRRHAPVQRVTVASASGIFGAVTSGAAVIVAVPRPRRARWVGIKPYGSARR